MALPLVQPGAPPNPERQVLISHKYLFILAGGKKVVYVHSCLQQIIAHQEGNRLAIKRIKYICSCLVVWMRSLTMLVGQVSWRRWDCTTFSCSSLPNAASPALLLLRALEVLEGPGQEFLPFSSLLPDQSQALCS